MKNEVLGERLRLFKDRDSLDEFSLCRKRQSYRNRRRGRREVRLSCAKKLIAANLLPLETISKVCCLSLEELEKIKSNITNLT